ncbi:helix-turn-helix domain-containing protein [Treponema sp. C6A8]|uniref:helix-turn-helix domain-containing protein n=1 Tax=Treponema sp. C6A8 TaxID=1410609 RepID=UPI000684CBCE|nr:helix-turn-helix transcriptional regulator [Treponema sp. C6A8]
MLKYKISPSFSMPVIDVEATSQNLKRLREERNIDVTTLKELFNFNYPQSIYAWENPKDKTLPCLDNLVTLAKLYKVSIDEMIVIKEEKSSTLSVHEVTKPYGIAQEALDFIRLNAMPDTKLALGRYYSISI